MLEASHRNQRRLQSLSFLDVIHDESLLPILAMLKEGEVAALKMQACKRSLRALPRTLRGSQLQCLRTLDLSTKVWYKNWHYLLDDTALLGFPPCPQLEELLLTDTDATDRGVEHMAQACAGLRVIDLTYCNRTTYHSVVSIRTHCPRIEVCV